MGTDNLFQKRREGRKQRNYGFKSPKVNSYLIVTEGERTDPGTTVYKLVEELKRYMDE